MPATAVFLNRRELIVLMSWIMDEDLDGNTETAALRNKIINALRFGDNIVINAAQIKAEKERAS